MRSSSSSPSRYWLVRSFWRVDFDLRFPGIVSKEFVELIVASATATVAGNRAYRHTRRTGADNRSLVLAVSVSLPVYDEYEKKEKCGLFGVWGTDATAQLCFQGLFAQQHRGQESAGIVVSDGVGLKGHADMGLVSQVFTPRILREDLIGHGGIAHVRYSTTGSSKLCNAQPLLRQYLMGPVAVAHNGNLINAAQLRREYEEHGHIFQSTTDTEVIVHLLAKPTHVEKHDPLPHVLKHLQGAFSLLFLFRNRIEAVCDPWCIRPLVLGRTGECNWCVASETCAFDAIGAQFVREIEPGEIVRIDDHGMHSRRFDAPAAQGARCVFEHVYFANPARDIFGQN